MLNEAQHNATTARHNATRVAPPSRVAVCIFGILARLDKRKGNVDMSVDDVQTDDGAAALLQNYSLPFFNRNLLHANPSSKIDVFVHNNEARREELVRQLFNPRTASFGTDGLPANISLPGTNGWRLGQTPRMFAAIERVLEHKRAAEAADGAPYDLVLLMRADAIFLHAFRFDHLDPSLFYIANWCDGAPKVEPHARSCRRLLLGDTGGTPDFYFAGGSAIVDKVFYNFTLEFEAGVFGQTKSSSNHALPAGRLMQLGLWRSLGRYLYHSFDVAIIRRETFSWTWRPGNVTRLLLRNSTDVAELSCAADHVRSTLTHAARPDVAAITRRPTMLPWCPPDWLWCVCPESSWTPNMIRRVPPPRKPMPWKPIPPAAAPSKTVADSQPAAAAVVADPLALEKHGRVIVPLGMPRPST